MDLIAFEKISNGAPVGGFLTAHLSRAVQPEHLEWIQVAVFVSYEIVSGMKTMELE